MAVAYLDIETTSQKADAGVVIAIGLLMDGEPEVRFAGSFEEEGKLLEWLRGKLEGCELIVTWYGSGFDIPFLSTRALAHNIDLTGLTEIPMLDLCQWSRANLLLSRYSLESVARFLGIDWSKEFHGTDILALFKLVERGDLEARELIVEHCKEDITVLKLIHERLKPLVERSGWGLPKTPKEE
ncbi:MAG: ribonuclease H-like domain-containing protein [Candidatus Hodarchaeaceae archaeon]|nr:ribonuclease H-like domain-containing protein [Candidatus Hodarchaeaceae archaeon]